MQSIRLDEQNLLKVFRFILLYRCLDGSFSENKRNKTRKISRVILFCFLFLTYVVFRVSPNPTIIRNAVILQCHLVSGSTSDIVRSRINLAKRIDMEMCGRLFMQIFSVVYGSSGFRLVGEIKNYCKHKPRIAKHFK